MKNKHIRLFAIIFACILTFTGCGPSLYELTESEEQLIVHYAAYIVAKHNVQQKDGMNNKYPSDEDLNENTEDPQITAAEEYMDSLKKISFGDAIGQPDVTVSYEGYVYSELYKEGDYSLLKPEDGYVYAVLSFKIYNPYIEAKKIDAFTEEPVFKASFNGNDPIKADKNFLKYNLSGYQGTLNAGESVDVVLLFQVPQEETESIDEVFITLEKDGTSYAIDLQDNQ